MRTSAARTNQSAALLRMTDFAAVFERVDDEVPFAEDVLERGWRRETGVGKAPTC